MPEGSGGSGATDDDLCAVPRQVRDVVGDEPFAVILPDDLVMATTPCLKQLVDVHSAKGGNVVAVENVPREHVNRYGVLDIDHDDGRLASVKGLVEKPAPGPMTVPGLIVTKRLRMEGFIVMDFYDQRAVAEARLARWVEQGRIKAIVDVIDGLENAPQALVGLFEGRSVPLISHSVCDDCEFTVMSAATRTLNSASIADSMRCKRRSCA